MAVTVPKIYFDIPKEISITNEDIAILTEENAVKESVKNIIEFTRGSLIYKKKNFGLNLTKFLFEPIDIITAHSILREIEEGIKRSEQRVNKLSVEVIPRPDENIYEINIRFSVNESDREIFLETTLEKIR